MRLIFTIFSMNMGFRCGCLLALILTTSTCLFAQSSSESASAEFLLFLEKIKQSALASGISTSTINSAFMGITLNQKVLALDKKQPEFLLSFGQYLSTRLSQTRLDNGQKYYEKYQYKLQQAEQEYGVAKSIIIAFWGLETNFGKNMGTFNAVEALASLAFDKRRRSFFSKELLAALSLLGRGEIPHQASSSWAGAMGQMQFMPSNIKRYGVDANQNGLNLWEDLSDVFFSAAYFLKKIGWHTQEKWGREVVLPKNFDYNEARLENEQLLTYWNYQGVRTTTGTLLPKSNLLAAIILPSGHQGPAFLVYRNFRAILNWNRSIFYALSVGLLSDYIAYGGTLYKPPMIEPRLEIAQVKKVQQKLIDLGFLKSTADGIIGTKTRAALRQFQRFAKQPADGYLDQNTLNLLDF